MDNEKNVIRLAKPVKKGLGSFIFSRLFLVIALLLIQVVILIALWLWATNKYPARLLCTGLTFVMVIYLFNNNMDASAAVLMLILSLLPAAGALTVHPIQHRTPERSELVKRQIDNTKEALKQPPDVIEEIRDDGSGTDDLAKYLNLSGAFHLQ